MPSLATLPPPDAGLPSAGPAALLLWTLVACVVFLVCRSGRSR